MHTAYGLLLIYVCYSLGITTDTRAYSLWVTADTCVLQSRDYN